MGLFGRGGPSTASPPEYGPLAKHLRRSYACDDPLHMFRRLDLVGLAFKGQLSSGYAQAGFGASFDATFDFGTLLAPGLIRVPVSASVGAERTDHHLLVITRMPTALYEQPAALLRPRGVDRDRPAPPGDAPQEDLGARLVPFAATGEAPSTRFRLIHAAWKGTKPLALLMLDGSTYKGAFQAGIGIEIGIGDPFAADEAGIALGAKAAGSIAFEFSDLAEPASRAFRPLTDSNELRDAVDEILATGLKEQLVRWMLVGHPDWAERHNLRNAAGGLADTIELVNTGWAGLQHDFPIDAEARGAFGALFAALMPKRRPSTADLRARLVTFASALDAAAAKVEDELATLDRRFARLRESLDALAVEEPPQTDLDAWRTRQAAAMAERTRTFEWRYDAGHALRNEIAVIFATMPSAVERRAAIARRRTAVAAAEAHRATIHDDARAARRRDREFVREFDRRLDERYKAKNEGPKEPRRGQDARNAGGSLLRVNSAVTVKVSGGIAFKAQLPKRVAGEEASFVNDYVFKHVRFRLQVGGEVTPRSRAGAGHPVLTQDTNVVQNVLTSRAGLSGTIRRPGSTEDPGVDDDTETIERRLRYGTVSYRSVSAYWYHAATARSGQRPKAYPNGSGVTFGLSVAPGRIERYAWRCRNGAEGEAALEDLLETQLRIDKETMRGFFAAFPFPTETTNQRKHLYESGHGFERPLVVESGHGFDRTVELPPLERRAATQMHEPGWLFDQVEAKTRLDAKAPGPTDGTSLRVLRVRYPIATDEDRSRSVFSFGWTSAAGDPPTAESLDPRGRDQLESLKKGRAKITGTGGIGLTRIRRVGTEGFVELHTRTFPPLIEPVDWDRAEHLRGRAFDHVHDFVVPPVPLFGHDR